MTSLIISIMIITKLFSLFQHLPLNLSCSAISLNSNTPGNSQSILIKAFFFPFISGVLMHVCCVTFYFHNCDTNFDVEFDEFQPDFLEKQILENFQFF